MPSYPRGYVEVRCCCIPQTECRLRNLIKNAKYTKVMKLRNIPK